MSGQATKKGYVKHEESNQGQAPMFYTGFMIQGLITTVEVVEKTPRLTEESDTDMETR